MRGTAERLIEAVIILFAITLLAGQVVGQPLLLGYVETGSMEPTLEPGDGFISLPPEVVGELSPGDVIVYRAKQVNGGGLTTHRIVGETDRGYITQGDANPFTDQSAGEPPVRDPQIVGVGVRAAGNLVTIPELGTGVVAIRSIGGGLQQRVPAHMWAGAGVAGLVILLASGSGGGRLDRTALQDRSTGHNSVQGPSVGPRQIILFCGAIVIATATASAIAPLGPTEYRVVSAEADLPGPNVIAAGETETTTYRVPGGTILPVQYYVESASDGVEVLNGTSSGRIRPSESANATIRLSAPPETGAYRRYVQEYRYPLVIPSSVVESLYQVDPLAPILVLDMILALPFLLAARFVSNRPQVRGSPGVSSGGNRLLGGSRND
ncbi:S26 family signal peptidase [Halorubrum sp. PV6]|uniref:S26 family signal peptidase n=1 Tax=Halorubrum sp. PV6 TaxID=634157 RepID=UPI000F84F536|nr:S26 family signal peptidase [Halorubrum sp. PV6]AZQ14309.1 S26 family signal peptidase [Halorubrum sp. PV6]